MLIYSEAKVGQRPMRSYTWKNQSLIGVSNRLLRRVDADAASAPHTPVYVNVADLKFSIVNALILAIALALGVSFIAAMPRRDRRTADSDADEFALLLLLMLMVSPLSFGYFYSWLMLPFAADWRWFTNTDRSPWYPNARLVRQPSPGQWAPVVEAVAQALSRELSDR